MQLDRSGFPLKDAPLDTSGRDESWSGQERHTRHVWRMAKKFKGFRFGLCVRVSVNPDSAEIVGHGHNAQLFGDVAGVDVGAVGDLRPDTHRVEGECAEIVELSLFSFKGPR